MSKYGTIDANKLSKAERDLLQADRPGYGSHTKLSVALNLVNAIVGAGIIGLPFAIAHAGFAVGILASILAAVLAQIGMYMLVFSGQRVGIYKYALLVEYMMGRFGYHFLNLIVLVQAGGGTIGYFILLGDSLPALLQQYLPQFPLLANRNVLLVFVGVFCIFPLCLSRSIGSLARWSFFSVLLLPVILLSVLIRAPANVPKDVPVSYDWVGSDIFGALGIMAFAFTCHQLSFSNFLSLKDQNTSSWRKTTSLAIGISWLISISFAMIGYVCFGKTVQANLFNNFPIDDHIINIGRLCLSISMILTIPMSFHPTREAVQKSLGFETADKQPTNIQHYTTTILLFGVILGMSSIIKSLGTVYSVVGGFSATTLSNILPAFAYFITSRVYTNETIIYPTTDTTATQQDEVKTPLLIKSKIIPGSFHSNNSHDDDEELVCLDDLPLLDKSLAPRWWMDIAAGLLIIWGLVVMFLTFSILF